MIMNNVLTQSYTLFLKLITNISIKNSKQNETFSTLIFLNLDSGSLQIMVVPLVSFTQEVSSVNRPTHW